MQRFLRIIFTIGLLAIPAATGIAHRAGSIVHLPVKHQWDPAAPIVRTLAWVGGLSGLTLVSNALFNFEAASLPLTPDLREFVDYRGSVYYSPLGYLPQASAMAVARLMGAGPLVLLYAGRLANLFTAIALLAWAVRILPVGREGAVLFALLRFT